VGVIDAEPMESGPLAGLRVVDFTHVLAGPYCTQLLADAGATVVKVEPPGGEHARSRGAQRRRADGLAVSSFFAAVNRGKLSVAIDLKSADGLAAAMALVKSASVVVENFAPGTLARLGLDLAELRARDPGLLTVSISLFGDAGTAGPLASRGGLAIVAEGESTVASMTRHHDGTPVTPGMPMGDMASGLAAYAAIVTALVERSRTGRGRHLEISMVRTLWALNSPAAVRAQMPDDGPSTKDLPAGYGVFPAADGFVAIGVNSDSLFTRLASAISRPDLAADPRFAGAAMRDQFADEINTVVAAWTRAREAQSIVEDLSRFDVPAGRVMTPAALLADQEMRAIGFVQTVADGLGGTIDTPSNPMGFSRAGAGIPRLNEHAGQILPEIGMAP
jgi:crotonobetainyl-CoA:carnitine CoA-transferase CaiB-like acyl-CoA transferase